MKIRPLLFSGLLATAVSADAQTPLLWYPFDDLTDPTADMGSGTAAPGSLNGASQFITSTPGGFSAGAFDTNGSAEGNNVSGGDADKLDGLSTFTITFWLNLQAAPAVNDRLISKRNGGTPPTTEGFFDLTIIGPSAGTFSDTNLRLQLSIDNGPAGTNYSTTDTSLAIGQWVFLAVTYDGAGVATSANDFFRGTESASAVQLTQSADPAGIGAILDNPAAFAVADLANFSGDRTPDSYFDDVRVYGTVLTPTEIEAVRVSNIPEPTSATLLLGGAALLGAFRRRD